MPDLELGGTVTVTVTLHRSWKSAVVSTQFYLIRIKLYHRVLMTVDRMRWQVQVSHLRQRGLTHGHCPLGVGKFGPGKIDF